MATTKTLVAKKAPAKKTAKKAAKKKTLAAHVQQSIEEIRQRVHEAFEQRVDFVPNEMSAEYVYDGMNIGDNLDKNVEMIYRLDGRIDPDSSDALLIRLDDIAKITPVLYIESQDIVLDRVADLSEFDVRTETNNVEARWTDTVLKREWLYHSDGTLQTGCQRYSLATWRTGLLAKAKRQYSFPIRRHRETSDWFNPQYNNFTQANIVAIGNAMLDAIEAELVARKKRPANAHLVAAEKNLMRKLIEWSIYLSPNG